jgi:hypothetical protein
MFVTSGLICEFVTIPLIFCYEIPVVSLRKLCNCYELSVNNGYDRPVNFVTIPLFSRISLFLALRKPCFFWKNKIVTWRVATFSTFRYLGYELNTRASYGTFLNHILHNIRSRIPMLKTLFKWWTKVVDSNICYEFMKYSNFSNNSLRSRSLHYWKE